MLQTAVRQVVTPTPAVTGLHVVKTLRGALTQEIVRSSSSAKHLRVESQILASLN